MESSFTLTPEMAAPLRAAAKSLRKEPKKDPLQAEAFNDDETGATATQNAAAAELRQFIERIERLEEEKQTLADDIRDVIGEAKGRGYDTKAIRTIIRLRKKDTSERIEEENILQTYMAALGME